MADKETPVEDALKLIQSGMADSEVIRQLTEAGYSPVEISDALNQAKIKMEISRVPEGLEPSIMQREAVPKPFVPKPSAFAPSAYVTPSAPSMTSVSPTPITVTAEYPTYPYEYPTAPEAPKMETEAMEEIAEEIVNEKWLEIKGKISDVIEWKTYAEKRISSVDDRIKRIEGSMDRLQAALLTKVQEYGRNIKDLGSEMSALEGAFGKILSPFVENMRELSKITGELKTTAKKVPEIKIPPKKIIVKPEIRVIPKIIEKKVAAKPMPKKPLKAKAKVVKEVTVTKTYKK